MLACFHEKLPVLEKQSDDGFCSREGRGGRGKREIRRYQRYILDMHIYIIMYTCYGVHKLETTNYLYFYQYAYLHRDILACMYSFHIFISFHRMFSFFIFRRMLPALPLLPISLHQLRLQQHQHQHQHHQQHHHHHQDQQQHQHHPSVAAFALQLA